MSYNLTVVRKSSYLHATVRGENSPANIQQYLLDIQNACEKHNCKKVLIEENLSGPTIGTLDIFDVITKLSPDAARAKLKIAYIDLNSKHDMGAMRFAENTARNRNVNIRMFSSLREAEDWLLKGEQKIPPVNG